MTARLRPHLALWLLPMLLAPVAPCANAAVQAVYRCGSNTYTQIPCAQGNPIEVDDSRSDTQRAEARDVAAREAALAAQMATDRQRADAASRPVRVPARSKTRPVTATTPTAAKALDKRTRRALARRHDTEDGDFVAFSPAPPRGGNKSKR